LTPKAPPELPSINAPHATKSSPDPTPRDANTSATAANILNTNTRRSHPAAAAAAAAVAPSTPIPADDHVTPAPDLTPDPISPGPDDGYASGTESSSSRASTSLASHVRDYSFEKRRWFHRYKEGQYHFPNDDDEQEARGNEAYHGLGDEYPEAEIIGVDLSPIQPEFVPPNVRFMVDDAEMEWVYPDNHFDLRPPPQHGPPPSRNGRSSSPKHIGKSSAVSMPQPSDHPESTYHTPPKQPSN
ncbi:TAM domain methyltransferase, partial [Colletotrichum salicis]